jgi:hypothetical protein
LPANKARNYPQRCQQHKRLICFQQNKSKGKVKKETVKAGSGDKDQEKNDNDVDNNLVVKEH